MGVCSNMSETLGNNMHVTRMSCLFIAFHPQDAWVATESSFQLNPGTQNTKCRQLTHLPTRSVLCTAIPTHTWQCGFVRLQTIFSPHDSNPHALPSQAPVPQAQVKCFQGPRSIFTVVWSASRLCNYAWSHDTDLVVFCLLPFLVSLMKSGMKLFYPDKSCGFTVHFHSTYNFRMTSSVCSQNSVDFNVLIKLLMCNKW